MGKGDSRLHARTQADADTMAAKWAATFGNKPDGLKCFGKAATYGVDTLTDAERDAMWRAGTHIQRGRDK